MGDSTFLLAAAAWAVMGLVLSAAFYRWKSSSEAPRLQLLAVGLSLGCGAPLLVTETVSSGAELHLRVGSESFVFLAASLCHLPLIVHVALCHWNRILEAAMSPGRKDGRRGRRPSLREEWKTIRTQLENLARRPLDVRSRSRLAEAYLRLDMVDPAIGELRRVVECTDRGYEQANVLYKIARLLADRKNDLPAALPVLRRIIRVYPRSYFAAYARRVVNHVEARQASGQKP